MRGLRSVTGGRKYTLAIFSMHPLGDEFASKQESVEFVPPGTGSSGSWNGGVSAIPTVGGVAQDSPDTDSLWQINWAAAPSPSSGSPSSTAEQHHLDDARALIEGPDPLLLSDSKNTGMLIKLDVRTAVGSTPVVAVRFLSDAGTGGGPHDGHDHSNDDRIFECQRLCARTWSLNGDKLPNERFLCWWVAVAVVEVSPPSSEDHDHVQECFLLPRRTSSNHRAVSGLDITTPDLLSTPGGRDQDPENNSERPLAPLSADTTEAALRAFVLNRSNILGQYPVSSPPNKLGHFTTGEINYSFRVFLFLWPVGIFATASTIWWALRHWR